MKWTVAILATALLWGCGEGMEEEAGTGTSRQQMAVGDERCSPQDPIPAVEEHAARHSLMHPALRASGYELTR